MFYINATKIPRTTLTTTKTASAAIRAVFKTFKSEDVLSELPLWVELGFDVATDVTVPGKVKFDVSSEGCVECTVGSIVTFCFVVTCKVVDAPGRVGFVVFCDDEGCVECTVRSVVCFVVTSKVVDAPGRVGFVVFCDDEGSGGHVPKTFARRQYDTCFSSRRTQRRCKVIIAPCKLGTDCFHLKYKMLSLTEN